MPAPARRGFTLIELLVVIAVIAILAALLFPVFNRVKEGTRMTSCMSNMHNLWVAVSQYKDDNGQYPNLLLGYAENADGTPYTGGSTPPVPAGKQIHNLLMKYLKNDVSTFRCPDNPESNPTAVTTAVFPPSSKYQPSPVTLASLGFPLPETAYLYKMDSYDISPLLSATGATDGSYQFVYSRNWTGVDLTDPIKARQDAPNQMKFPNPPPDRTTLTWCNYHVAIAKGDKCPVMRLSGTAKPIDYKQMVTQGWNIGP